MVQVDWDAWVGVQEVSVPGGKSPLGNLPSDPRESEKFEETQTDRKVQMVTSEVQTHFAEPACPKRRMEGK